MGRRCVSLLKSILSLTFTCAALLHSSVAFADPSGVAVGIASPPAKLGAQFPKRKPGLWEMTMTVTGMATPQSAKTYHCIDEATDQQLQAMTQTMSAGYCDKNESRNEGDKFVIETDCSMAGSKMKSKSVFSGDYSSAYHGDVQVSYDPPLQGVKDSSTTIDVKWVGACKPDQQPGDVIMPNGTKINVLKQMQAAHGK